MRMSMRKVHALGVNRFMTYQLLRFLAEPTMCGKRMRRFRLLVFTQELLAHRNQTMHEEPHIGHLIKTELRKQGRTITWLASQLGYSRQNMYKLFERRWIYTDLLLKISDIMGHDFFKCYSEYWSCRRV